MEAPTLPSLFFCLRFFGLAANTKYSFYIILPIWACLLALKIFAATPQTLPIGSSKPIYSRWEKMALYLGFLALAGLTAIWMAYGFRFAAIPEGAQTLPIRQVMPKTPLLNDWLYFIYDYRLLPEAWIYGQLFVLQHIARPTYLLGEISNDGFWSYFPIAFSVKTPLPPGHRHRVVAFKGKGQQGECVLADPILYFPAAIPSRMNIGLRHLLPIYPFVFVIIGSIVGKFWQDHSGIKRSSVILFGAWYSFSRVTLYPHFLTFFNEFARGPRNGHRILVDSNLDWGQDQKVFGIGSKSIM